MSDEGSIVSPKMVELTMYEDRHGDHVIEARSGIKRIRIKVPYAQRTPLSKSSAEMRLVIDEVLS